MGGQFLIWLHGQRSWERIKEMHKEMIDIREVNTQDGKLIPAEVVLAGNCPIQFRSALVNSREHKGYTQVQFAKLAKISVRTLYLYEKGLRLPRRRWSVAASLVA